jgi:hypothetical protein
MERSMSESYSGLGAWRRVSGGVVVMAIALALVLACAGAARAQITPQQTSSPALSQPWQHELQPGFPQTPSHTPPRGALRLAGSRWEVARSEPGPYPWIGGTQAVTDRAGHIAATAGPPAWAASGDDRPTGRLIAAGVVASAVGAVGGAIVGYNLDHGGARWGCAHGCEDPGLIGLVGGWMIGPALATPLAVHIANDGRGSLGASLLPALAIGVGGLVLVHGAGKAAPVPFFAAPVAQVVSAVTAERRTTSR